MDQIESPLALTIQLLCRGEARGLRQSLNSLKACHQPIGLKVEIQLLPWQLSPSGIEQLTIYCSEDPALIWLDGSGSDLELEASARCKANQHARGPWIWWLENGDRLQHDALMQWAMTVRNKPDKLLMASDGVQLDTQGQVLRRHGALPSSTRLRQLVQEQLYCPGGLCVHQQLLRRVPLPIRADLSWSYREAWLVEVLETNHERVHVVPHCWVQTQALVDGETPHRCREQSLELTKYLSERWGEAPTGLLHRYGLQLLQKEAALTEGVTPLEALASALSKARPWLKNEAWERLQTGWGLNSQTAPWQQRLENSLHEGGLQDLWSVTLLRNLLHPELWALQLGPAWGPNIRLAEQLVSADFWKKYCLLRQDTELHRLLNQTIEGVPIIALLQWQREPRLQKQFPPTILTKSYGKWWGRHAHNELRHLSFNQSGEILPEEWPKEACSSPEDRPFGVNLVGHAFEALGLGEDVRMAAQALESAGVPFCVINIPSRKGATGSNRSLEKYAIADNKLAPYRFNLICMTAISHGTWVAQRGLSQHRGHTTIVSWPWETETWPREWECMLKLADVLWPASTFTAKALEPFSHPRLRPLQVMPMAVHIDQPEQYRTHKRRQKARERWSLGQESTLVLVMFDVKSSIARKNPWGAIKAFQHTFPDKSNNEVQLVIKALPPASTNQDWRNLKKVVRLDPRLRLIESDLERPKLLELMGACDVLLSLHRSEGFGRCIAEAAILGLQVVTSNWGGNADFSKGLPFRTVSCTPVQIKTGEYVQAEGHWWGEPNLGEACMQLLDASQNIGYKSNPNRWIETLSAKSTGERYRKALYELLGR